MKVELTKEWCMNMAKIEARAAELHEGCQMPMEQARAALAQRREPLTYRQRKGTNPPPTYPKPPAPPAPPPVRNYQRHRAFVNWYQSCECQMTPEAIWEQGFQAGEAAHGIAATTGKEPGNG